jgi:hypothetical protein
VHQAEVEMRVGIVLPRGAPVPRQRLLGIARQAVAFEVVDAKLQLRIRITRLRWAR